MSITATAPGVLLGSAVPALAWARGPFPSPASLLSDVATAPLVRGSGSPAPCGNGVGTPLLNCLIQPTAKQHNGRPSRISDSTCSAEPCRCRVHQSCKGACQTLGSEGAAPAGADAKACAAGVRASCSPGSCDAINVPRSETHRHASTSSSSNTAASSPHLRRRGPSYPGAAAPACLPAATVAAGPQEADADAKTRTASSTSPLPPRSLQSSRGPSTSGASDSAGPGAVGGAGRRPAFGVKPSQITSQISAVQRNRAATVIQAAWRGFRIRRLYLRLIVWRLRSLRGDGAGGAAAGSPGAEHVYRGIGQFPPIPDLPPISLFTRLGRPARYHATPRRVWFDIGQPRRAAPPPPPPPPLAPGTGPVGRCSGPGPPLRLSVPTRAEADVPVSEVERILAGGFWRDEPPPPVAAAAAAGPGGGPGPEGEEGLSMFMRAKMRQEEREAEEALQMLCYEPTDLRHRLGSLKGRTLERLGSLGRSISGSLAEGSRRLLSRAASMGGAGGGGGGGAMSGAGAGGLSRSSSMADGGATASGAGGAAGVWGAGGWGGGRAAWSLPRLGGEAPRLWAAGGGGRQRSQGDHDSCLRVPLLHLVDAAGHEHTEPPPPHYTGKLQQPHHHHDRLYYQQQHHSRPEPQHPHAHQPQHPQHAGQAARSEQGRLHALQVGPTSPIAVNRDRYRSRSHVTRMSY